MYFDVTTKLIWIDTKSCFKMTISDEVPNNWSELINWRDMNTTSKLKIKLANLISTHNYAMPIPWQSRKQTLQDHNLHPVFYHWESTEVPQQSSTNANWSSQNLWTQLEYTYPSPWHWLTCDVTVLPLMPFAFYLGISLSHCEPNMVFIDLKVIKLRRLDFWI
jgi:hypothetical protein